MEIKIYGDEVLREKCVPVEHFDEELRELVVNMADTMYEARGIGLAAPQVGDRRRLFLTDIEWPDVEETGVEPARNYRVWINPEILEESAEDCAMTEGCLSIPGVEGDVYRPITVRIRYQDLAGEVHEEALKDLQSRCCQHELDHLNGVLFVDRMPFVKRQMLAGRLNDLKRGKLPA